MSVMMMMMTALGDACESARLAMTAQRATSNEADSSFSLLNFRFFILYTASLLMMMTTMTMKACKRKIHMMPYLNVSSNDSFSVILPLARLACTVCSENERAIERGGGEGVGREVEREKFSRTTQS